MAKSTPKIDLRSYTADELLAELRSREQGDVTTHRAAVAKTSKELALATVGTPDLTKALRDAQKVIYGTDDRIEAHQITDQAVQHVTQGVASLIDMSDITDNGDGTSTISTVTFGVANNLCSGERFRDQPTSPFCTGFLVGEQLLATAGHCVNNNNLARTRFVFGFRMNPDGTATTTIPNDDIYEGTALIARKLESAGSDYAVVKLDRPATGRPVLPIRRMGKIADGRAVYVMGHPSGLPLKYAPGAAVRNNTPTAFFVANLDTYGGNSGSPVFDELTNTVEGILVRGETDFVLSGTCRVSNVCPTSGCRGEDVTRTTEFVEFVPEVTEDDSTSDDSIEDRVDNLEVKVEGILKIVERIEKKL